MNTAHIIAIVNTSKKPSNLRVKEYKHTYLVDDVVRIEKDFVEYPRTMNEMTVRKDYKFTFSDGTWQRYNRPVIRFAE